MSDDNPANRERVFDFIVEYKRKHDGIAPPVSMIGKMCHLSKSTVQYHLFQLEKMRRIRIMGRRGIEVIGGAWDFPE